MTTQKLPNPELHEPDLNELNKRLETIGWALFLIMIGGIGLVPNTLVPEGTWLIGVGLIMLGLNYVRYFYGIRMSSGTLFLGVLALMAGVANFFGFELAIFPVILILIGLSELSKTFFEKKVE